MSEVEWMDIFADNLVNVLDEANMTQKELADAIGVTKSIISRYINKQRMPSLKNIINMSDVLNISIDELIYFGDVIIWRRN